MQIGSPAPLFTLYNSEKESVSLSDLRGKNVLLLFFPFAFTSTCTKELCFVRDNIAIYNKANALVFGISVDSPYTLAKYKQEQQLNFPLLSDFNKEVSAAYNTLYPTFSLGMKGVSKRSAFVIDKNGSIQHFEILENAGEVPNFTAINDTLGSLESEL